MFIHETLEAHLSCDDVYKFNFLLCWKIQLTLTNYAACV